MTVIDFGIESPGQTLGLHLRRVFNNGAMWLCLGLFSAVLGALSARVMWTSAEKHAKEMGTVRDKWMSNPVPMGTEEFPGVAAAALARLPTRDSPDELAPGVPLQAAIERTVKSFSARAAKADIAAADKLEARDGDFNEQVLWSTYGTAYQSIGDQGRSIVVVPSTLNQDPGAAAPVFPARVRRAAALRGPLEEAVAEFRKDATIATEIQNFVQVYFISVDGVLVLWGERQKQLLKDFPHVKSWSAAKYIRDTWDMDRTSSRSRPAVKAAYFDYGGNGVVRTVVHPVVLAGEERPLGFLCFDHRSPLRELVDSVQKSRYLSGRLVALSDRSPDSAPLRSRSLSDIDEALGPAAATASDQDLLSKLDVGGLEDASSGNLRRGLTSPKNLRGITEVRRTDQSTEYLLPLGVLRDKPGDASRVGLLVTVTSPTLPAIYTYAQLLLGASIALGAAALLMGFVTARGVMENSLEAAVLRSLPLAVMWTDSEDVIINANDAAERLLRRRFPRRGHGVQPPPVKWTELIDTTRVQDAGSNVPGTYETVVQETRMGNRASSYVVRTKEHRKVIRVIGVPVEGLGGEGTAPRTFGVIVEGGGR